MTNLFSIPEAARLPGAEEFFEPLARGKDGLLVERIVSYGQSTPENTWYDQDRDEWVAVLEGRAKLLYEDGSELTLNKGDHVFIPRRVRHRVAQTSSPCVWLAVHGNLSFAG